MEEARPGRSRWVRVATCLALASGAPAGMSGQAAADPTEARARIADLGAYIESSFADWGFPGLAVAVVYQDEVIFAEGFGVRELGRPDSVDAGTLFQIGSVSKSFAAAAIGALVDDGLAGWDDPVVRHVPWFQVRDPWVTRNMTIRDLLSHRSGIPEDSYPVLAVTTAREAAERVRFLENQAPFRQSYRYSNQGYGLAGLVVEAVTGKRWGEWVRDRLFAPLKMHESAASPHEVWDSAHVATAFLGTAPAGGASIDDAPGRNVAMPHGVARDGSRRILAWQSYDSMQGAGSIVASAAELANWLRLHLAEGVFAGERVLGEATVREMHRPQIAIEQPSLFGDGEANGTGPPTGYGLGWTTGWFEGRRQLSHGGGIFGFPAWIALLPEIGAGVAVLANGSLWTPYYPHQEIGALVFARLLGAEERDWHGVVMERTARIEETVRDALAARDAARIPNTAPSLPLADYAGVWEHLHGGRAHVEIGPAGALRVHFGAPGSFSGEMEHWHHDVFQLYFDGGDGQAYASAFVTFTVGPAGRADRMDMGILGIYRRAEP